MIQLPQFIGMDNTLNKKQTYLRIQILEAGLDGGEFMQYLTNLNAKKGHDLNLWSFEELQGVVDSFRKVKLPSNPYSVVQKSQIVATGTENPPAQKNNADDIQYNQKIKCQLKQVNAIYGSCDLMKIKVTKFQKVEGGMFERSYISYTIQVPYLKTIVSRRYSEFVWLRDTLLLLYPGLPIPPVAKKSGVARYQDKYLTKKMYILQKFMNTLTKIKEICSDIIFEKFLTIVQPKQFQKFKTQYAKLCVLPINKVKTLQGTINSSTENRIVAKIAKYQQYLKQTQPEIKKIYKNFKGAATNLQIASQFLKSVSSNCKFLRKKQQSVRVDLQLPPVQQKSVLLMLQNFSREYSSSLLQHARSFRKEIYSMSKYESLYRINMIDTIQQLNLKQAEYLRMKTELLKKKEKLFAEGKVSKWGLKDPVKPSSKEEAFAIMLPKETAQLLQLRETYGMYNNGFYQQCLRHSRGLNKDLALYIRQFIEMQARYFTDGSIMLDEVLTKTRQVEAFHNST